MEFRRVLFRSRHQLAAQVASLASITHKRLLENRGALERHTATLQALSPIAILNRGYALVFDATGDLVKDATRLKPGDDMSARVARGRVRARVTGIEPPES